MLLSKGLIYIIYVLFSCLQSTFFLIPKIGILLLLEEAHRLLCRDLLNYGSIDIC